MSYLARVSWRDAWFDPEQKAEDEWKDEYRVMTTGWVVRDTENVLSLAQEVLPFDDGFRAVTHIPRQLVLEIKRLVEVEA